MSSVLSHCLRGPRGPICVVIGVVLFLAQPVFAPPGGARPKPPPKKPPAGARSKKHPGPKAAHPPAKHPPAKVKHPRAKAKHGPHAKRYVRHHRYWHPRYRVAPARTVWHSIGYPYYLGGTSYTIVSPPNGLEASSAKSPTVIAVDTGTTEADSADPYAQIQELVELIHEWRTLNESPALHGRLASSEASAASRPTVAAIRQENQQFDAVTRAAMRKLARGESAESDLESARTHLQKLIELVESLPETP